MNDHITLKILPEEAVLIRSILLDLNDAIDKKLSDGTNIINYINQVITGQIDNRSFDIRLNPKEDEPHIKPVDDLELQKSVDLIDKDLVTLGTKKSQVTHVCEVIEKVLINLQVGDLS